MHLIQFLRLSMGWVDQRVRLGWVGLGRDFAVFDGLGWVEYDKSTIFLMITQHRPYNCTPVELLASSGKVYILIICAVRRSLLSDVVSQSTFCKTIPCNKNQFLLYGYENPTHLHRDSTQVGQSWATWCRIILSITVEQLDHYM